MESRTREIRVPHAEGVVVEKLCQYLYYWHRKNNLKQNAKDKGTQPREKFVIPPGLEIKLMRFSSLLHL